jgi:hypothetical protein
MDLADDRQSINRLCIPALITLQHWLWLANDAATVDMKIWDVVITEEKNRHYDTSASKSLEARASLRGNSSRGCSVNGAGTARSGETAAQYATIHCR